MPKNLIQPYPFTLALTRDVLVIEVELSDGKYPSANDGGGAMRFAAKSDVYKRLAATVDKAGSEAVMRGWQTVKTQAEYRVVRVAADRRVRDAANIGGCEANSLSRSRVWSDDCVAAPVSFDVQVDTAGPDRVNIIVMRVHQRNETVREARPVIPKRARGIGRGSIHAPPTAALPVPGARQASDASVPDSAIGGRTPLINGKPAAMDEVLALIEAKMR